MVRRSLFSLLTLALIGCPDAVTRKIDEGNRLARAGKLDDAAARFEQAAQMSHAPRARVLLGNVRWAQGRRDDARHAYDDALDAGPDDADALVALARAQLYGGDATGALGSTAAALQSAPARADAHLLRAAARLALQQDLSGALEDTDAAMPPGADDSDALYLKGCVLIALHRFADAQAAFSSLESRHPKSALSAYGQARLAAAQNHKTDLKAYLLDARGALGEHFDAARVALDPAFDFVRDDPQFSLPGRDAGP